METNEWRFNRIVVGIDGSAGARRAVHWAIALAKRTGAEIVAVHIGQPILNDLTVYGYATPVPLPDWQDEVRGNFQEVWCLPLRKSGVPFRTVFDEGPAGPQLLEVAEREGAGLIVTGSRGLGPVREVIVGSVSHYVAQHADVPVVVVPPDRHARQMAARPVVANEPVPFPATPVLS